MLVSGLITGGVMIIVAGPVTLFVLAFLRQAIRLLSMLQRESSNRQLPTLQYLLDTQLVRSALEATSGVTHLSPTEILDTISDYSQRAFQAAAGLSGSLLIGTLSVLTQFFLTLFLLFFFLRDGERLLRRAMRLTPLPDSRKAELFAQLGGVTRAVVLGTLATAAIQGTLVGVGFMLVNLPSPLVFGAMAAVTSLIPIVGTGLVWVPAAIALYVQGSVTSAIILSIWSVLLVGAVDNIIRPLIISGKSAASTLVVFIGILGGVPLFGIAGIFIGPLTLILAGSVLRYMDEARGYQPEQDERV